MTRIEKLRAALPAGCDGALVYSITNREYLSCFLSGDAGTLLVFRDAAYFIIDSRYIEIAKKTVAGAEVVLQGKLYDQVKELCRKHGVKRLLLEQEMTIGECESFKKGVEGVEFVTDTALSDLLRKQRSIKDAEEVRKISAAQAITDAAFLDILNFIRPGRTEKEVAAELEYYMRKRGADGLAFETIIASGENGSMPHAVPGDRKIREGDFVTMDFGAKLDGYCSDMTRTVAVGTLTDEQYRVYDTVLRAHLTSMAAAHPGVLGYDLDRIARDIINGAGYEGAFGHSLGHSLGLDIHEWPNSTPNRKDVLEDGTIMTIEPGIYLEGRFGVRIENMILITGDGYRNLTGSERALITLR